MKIRVIVTGRSYHTAGALPNEIELRDGSMVEDALRVICEQLPDDQPFPASCLIAVAGEHLGTIASYQNKPLQPGDELVLIAPVAGG